MPNSFGADAPPKLTIYFINETEYYSLWEFSNLYYPSGKWRIDGTTVHITGDRGSFSMTMDEQVAWVNGIRFWLSAPAKHLNGRTMIPKADALTVLRPMWTGSSAKAAPHRNKRIVLDPGHGGVENGTKGKAGVLEKRLTLDVATRIEKMLLQEGFEVVMTRRTDKGVALEERAELANQQRGNLFVSIHFNWAPQSSARGIETFILPPAGTPSSAGNVLHQKWPGNKNDEANARLAYLIQRAVIAETGAYDRGVKRARFIVLRNVESPAALVELGFLSNAAEENLILTEAYREQLARGVTRGILNYFNTPATTMPRRSRMAAR